MYCAGTHERDVSNVGSQIARIDGNRPSIEILQTGAADRRESPLIPMSNSTYGVPAIVWGFRGGENTRADPRPLSGRADGWSPPRRQAVAD